MTECTTDVERSVAGAARVFAAKTRGKSRDGDGGRQTDADATGSDENETDGDPPLLFCVCVICDNCLMMMDEVRPQASPLCASFDSVDP